MTLSWRQAFLAALACVATTPAPGAQPFITVASTTSTENSGLFRHLLPVFEKQSGIKVHVVARGTGQALDMARRGDADVVFVHAKPAEERFIAEGHGVKRYPVMYNDFVLVGPGADPAGVANMKDVAEALQQIKARQAAFVSRGDRSGTHMAEIRLWQAAGIDIGAIKGPWYRELGQGMGASLNIASAMNGYILTDRGSWIAFRNRGDLAVLVEGDRRLFNQYGVILVNPQRHPGVKQGLGQAFIDWLISPEGQQAIAGYRIDGQQLFFPNAADGGA